MVEQVLNDWRSAPIDDRLRAMLGFLEKLTLQPLSVTREDIVPLRTVGLSDEAIEDAIHSTVLFNIYDRVADTLGFEIPGPESFAQGAKNLLRRGYL